MRSSQYSFYLRTGPHLGARRAVSHKNWHQIPWDSQAGKNGEPEPACGPPTCPVAPPLCHHPQ